MRKLLNVVMAALALLLVADPAFAQGQNGRGVGKPRVGVSYYKLPPGRQDEWLALYKKWHRPIMDYQIANGATISSKIFVAGNHAISPSWDIAIINVSPPAGQAKPLPLSRAALIRKLFPDQEAYVKAERERWALTLQHWDEEFVELDINEEPFSLYYPIGK